MADTSNSIIQTPDLGYIMVGHTQSTQGNITNNNGDADFWIVKTDAFGNLVWQKTYGGTYFDDASSVQNTSDGGYIVAGYTTSNDGNVTQHKGEKDFWIVKIDTNGNLQWQKTYGGTENDWASSIKQTSDGGFIIAGTSQSQNGDITNPFGNTDYWVVKTDNQGNLQWQKSYGGSSTDTANDIQLTSDGGYILIGLSNSSNGLHTTASLGGSDIWVVKISNIGNLEWEKKLGNTSNDIGQSIKQTTDQGYILAGLQIIDNITKFWTAKLDTFGNTQWENLFGYSGINRASSIIQLADGNYLATGYTNDNSNLLGHHGNSDVLLVKINTTGSVIWYKCLGGSLGDQGNSVIQTTEGDYVISGISGSNNGDVTINNGGLDKWVVKLTKEVLSTNEILLRNKLSFYPNPTQNKVTIDNLTTDTTIATHDFSGKQVYYKKHNDSTITIDVSSFAKGVYTVSIKNEKENDAEKLIVQ